MIVGSPRAGFAIRVGKDYWSDARLSVTFGIGYREGAPPNEIPWRRFWRWSSSSLPAAVFRQFRWKGVVITMPIGYRLAGRYRIFWGF